MGFKIKNSLTGEFEKLPILTLKGEKGETGGVEEYNKVDYMGNKYETLKQANDANVEYAVKTAIGEFNYLDYEGQHITATDTIEGHAKSAILTGQTLVNINKTVLNNGKINPQYYPASTCDMTMLKTETKYLVIIYNDGDSDAEFYLNQNSFKWNSFTVKTKNIYKTIGTTKTEILDGIWLSCAVQQTTEQNIRVMLIEYQDGMENWDIPYFEGMKSVQMPVLTTTGKNLFDINKCKPGRAINDNGNEVTGLTPDYYAYGEFIPINNEFTMSITSNNGSVPNNANGTRLRFYDEDKNLVDSQWFAQSFKESNGRKYRTISMNGAKYLKISFSATGGSADTTYEAMQTIQIEEGSTATSFEPYKSNILTVNEDVELRGIGEIQDTLDCLTGELTQRIGEDVLDGSQGLTITGTPNQENTLCVLFPDFPKIGNGVVMSDELIKASNYDYSDTECITQNAFGIAIRLLRNRLESADINGVKKFLSQNPITVQYQLETESVKTVDLSDNAVYSYDEVTHYDCSSAEGSLVPTLSVKVPTDVQATIAQQRETIQTLNSENERLNQIQEALKASMLDSQVQLMNLSWNTDFEVFTLRESIAPKDFLLDSRTGSNIDKFSQAKFIIENDCQDLEKLNSQIEYYFSKDVFSQEQFEELTDLISIVKGENSCEY